jgi:hypothetical protein
MKYITTVEIIESLTKNKVTQEEISEFALAISNTNISVTKLEGDGTEIVTHNGLVVKGDAAVNSDSLRYLILIDYLRNNDILKEDAGVDMSALYPGFFAKWNRVDTSKFGGYKIPLPDFKKKSEEKKAEKPESSKEDEEEL